MRNEEVLATAVKALIDEQISNLDFSDVVADVIPTLDLDDLLRPTIDTVVENAIDGFDLDDAVDMDEVHRNFDLDLSHKLEGQVVRLINDQVPDIVKGEVANLLYYFPGKYADRCDIGVSFTRAVKMALGNDEDGYDLPAHVMATAEGMVELVETVRNLQEEVAALKERQPLPPPMVKFAIPTGGGNYLIDGTEYAPVAK